MFMISVLYPAGHDFNLEYYNETHLPLVRRLFEPLGMTELAYWRPVEEDPDAAYQLIAEIRFDTRENALKALERHGAETRADIDRFTTADPLVQMGTARLG